MEKIRYHCNEIQLSFMPTVYSYHSNMHKFIKVISTLLEEEVYYLLKKL